MNENAIHITDGAALADWVRANSSGISLKDKQATLLVDALIHHRIDLLADGDSLIWKEAGGEGMSVTVDDVIDQVCEWNFHDIRMMREACMNSEGFVEYCQSSDKLAQLKKVERQLDKIFEQTVYGRQIDKQARELAKRTLEGAYTYTFDNLKRSAPDAIPLAVGVRYPVSSYEQKAR